MVKFKVAHYPSLTPPEGFANASPAVTILPSDATAAKIPRADGVTRGAAANRVE